MLPIFMIPIHKPVMPNEIVHFLKKSTNQEGDSSINEPESPLFLDVTAGEGGHSIRILEEFKDSFLVISDRDEEMLGRTTQRLEQFKERFLPIRSNFSSVNESIPADLLKRGFDGIIADLGISMFHILDSGRGFSFKKEEDLDMRLDKAGKSAADIINHYSENELLKIFYEFGEERWSKKIVERIMEQRKKSKFRTTKELAELIERTIPRKFWPPARHPSFRIFQALRIEVNNELSHIQTGMETLAHLLKPGGVLCVISFHSLEDRIVKHGLREISQKENFTVLTKKPLLPTEEEIVDNISSRSAKLRVLLRQT